MDALWGRKSKSKQGLENQCVSMGGAAALLGVVSLVAALAPACRAAGIDPVEPLRAE
jgi:hypothetical protein